ncbi:hypothetical protein M987_00078 [Enterobacter soli ATCC BAA-2102]|nr:hypothetical protein M987_00078 [Enterobacter soli ATCC BAA-2102]
MQKQHNTLILNQIKQHERENSEAINKYTISENFVDKKAINKN